MTTNSATIKKLSADPSKTEEIEFFATITESIPAGAYLKDFFVSGLEEWVTFQLRSDFPPELWNSYQQELKEHQETRVSCAADLDRAKREHAAEEMKLQSDLSKTNFALDLMTARFEQLSERYDLVITDIANLRNDYRIVSEQLEIAELNLLRLKARLFDISDRAD